MMMKQNVVGLLTVVSVYAIRIAEPCREEIHGNGGSVPFAFSRHHLVLRLRKGSDTEV